MNLHTKILFALYFFFSVSVFADKLSDSFFDDADSFLKKYVKNDGLVNYVAIENESGIDNIIEQIEGMDLSEASASEKKAFYINAYNISVIAQVMDHYPVNSVLTGVKDPNGNDLDGIEGFFNVNKQTVAGEEITLDVLEKERLIKAYNDSRIHFVVVCAALSCPPLSRDAFRPETVEAQIETQTSKSVNDPGFTIINRENKTLELSQIYNWFIDDFGGTTSSTISFLNDYLEEPITTDYAVSYYFYNWSINEILGDPTGLFDSGESYISITIVNDMVNFSKAEGRYQLIDLKGQIYASGETNDHLGLKVYNSGIYILKVEYRGELFTEKILID